MFNLKLKKIKKMTNFRRFSISTWKGNFDPAIKTTIPVRMESALEYLSKYKRFHRKAILPVHLVIKATAIALRKYSGNNAILRGNHIYLRDNICISASIVDKNGALVTIRFKNVEKKNLTDIVDELRNKVIETRNQPDNTGPEAFMSKVPMFLLRPLFRFFCFLMFRLNLNLKYFGFEQDSFGVAEVTYVGALGVDEVKLPLTPYTRVPFVIGPGIVKDAPVVDDGQLKVGKIMNINFSADHRYIDGFHGIKMVNTIKEVLENPFEYFDSLACTSHQNS